jgi:small-conductance mechanosensitive channel
VHVTRKGPFARFVFFVVGLVVSLCVFAPRAFAGANDGLAHLTTPVDQSTPRKALSGFITSAHAGNFTEAAHYLDLRDTPRAEQSLRGPELARELVYVLDQKTKLDVASVTDTPDAATQEVVAASILLDDEKVSVSLVRIPGDDPGSTIWVVSRSTVALIPALFAAFGPKGWEGHVPEVLTRTMIFGNAAWQWLGLALLFVLSWLAARFCSFAVVAAWKFFAKRAASHIPEELIGAVRTPLRVLFAIGVFRLALDSLALTVVIQNILDHAAFSLLVVGVSLLFLRLLKVAMGWAVTHLPADAEFELRRRELRTRFGLLLRIANGIVAILASAAILTQFSFVRTVGLSVLASAGIAGVVIGLAAQKSVSTVIAGVQISLTQPIRIGDVVKVESQTGTVEEVSLTNVVIRLTDQRRLIVPVSRFLDQPFENWTRRNTEILGTLTLIVDFATPIDDLRAEAKKIVEARALWDKRKFALTVSDVSQAGVQVTVLLSAADSSRLADLKDEVREALLKFLQQKNGGAYFIAARTAAVAAVVTKD